MSMILVMTDQPCVLDTETLARLGSPGVSNVTLLEAPSTAAVLVQGWAFDLSSAEETVEILTSGKVDVQVLQPVMQVSVSPRTIVDIRPEETRTMEKEEK